MKIVVANKYWFLKGGAERYMFDLAALFEKHGHETVPFAMRDHRDERTPWRPYFVSAVQTERVRVSWQGIRTAARMLYSFEARRKFSALLARVSPDVVHLHNIYHQISPSILGVAARRRVPIVMTAHDYKYVAPNYSLYHDGAICERTKPDRFWEAVEHRCVKGSKIASTLVALEMSLHRLLGLWNKVDRIIAPSRFMQALFIDYGVPADKVVHVPHFVDASAWTPTYEGSSVLYVGRLSQEKGVATLIRAATRIKHIPVRIVGTGPEEHALRRLAHEVGAANVEFIGMKTGDALKREYAAARFVVVPSEWYEVFGLVVTESFAAGKPVIATQLGGLGELIEEGETGLLANVADPANLAEKISTLWSSPQECARMGRTARTLAETEYTPENHYARILDVYRSVGVKV